MSRQQFRLDQPRPNDMVGDPVLLAGSGGGFEATISIRVLDANGVVVADTFTMARNLTSPWQAQVPLPGALTTSRGVVEVGPSTGADEAPARVSVPVFFGTRIVAGFGSWFLHVVQQGETLSGIAADAGPLYVGSGWQPIYEANADIVADPNLIHPGQVLRIPADF
jgi:nucleoid-associated protein YgaU